ncbi:hypothetical protein [Maribacter sp. 1_2014MBL_MicDiv]|uniref:hypothetical protein n=1 Tax=Maribacter sp. 1_2014MBL_MicDiv TaxID=1644130 RepID=UPI0008F5114E|nr:hypothetical protein [Maribacter sp. 1_2014MBL_MicDiv]APA64326.1 hypothetical protein YQ22_08345 [Maribacter sp. 1_2014MBL_MicDiv]
MRHLIILILLLSFNSCQTSNKVFKVYNYDEIETKWRGIPTIEIFNGKEIAAWYTGKNNEQAGNFIVQLLKRILFGRRNL